MIRAVTPLWLLVVIAVLHQASSAPVQDGVAIDKRRESTKETIELEETLKRLAGEDKKYFSNSLAMPMPQVDGLQDVEGSGEEEEGEAESPPAQGNPMEEQVNPLENQLMELPELEQEPAARYPVPGPFGPGLQSAPGSVEYEPSVHVEADDEAEEEEEEEDYYLERVMQTLRRHPELLDEIMQEEAGEEGDENEVENEAPQQAAEDPEDYEDRMEQIQAELDTIHAQEQRLVNQENKQEYIGDQNSHVVSKKRMVIPNEYVKDDLQSLNKYFDKFSGEASQEDVPIM